jgi:ATP-binding cassette subfamily F protein uup
LLILDEPTNHLDLEMIEWLENYFKSEKLTLFMVTHDRFFLERVCNEIVELENGKIYSYKGNYAYYLEKKEERQLAENASIDKAKNLFVKELDWMRRQPKARTTKSKSRIDDFYQIKEKALSRRKEHVIEIEFNMERMGSKVVELHKLNLNFDDKIILKDFTYDFQRGERIGIIGKNGTGKSTWVTIPKVGFSPNWVKKLLISLKNLANIFRLKKVRLFLQVNCLSVFCLMQKSNMIL